MKKMLFIGLFALVSLFSTGQNLIPKDASNAFLVFQRGDGIDTYYKIGNVKIFIDDATIGRIIEANSGIELVGFARTQSISPNIFDFVTKPASAPTVVVPQPDYQVASNRIQLKIPGYDDVSDIFLADAGLKIKDASRLNIQIATHSISLGENLGDRRSSVDYEIVDQTGKVWVQVIQKQTTVEGRLGGQYGNNHPDRQYLLQLPEDCNVYLPIDNTYTVKVTNKGTMEVDFWITHPWSENGQERRMYRSVLGVGNEDSFTFNAFELKNIEPYKATVKLNVNGKL